MLSSGIFKRGGPKKESGSVPVRPTNKHGDDPDGDSEPGSDASDGEDAAVSLQDLRDILSAPRSGKDLSAGIWHPQLCLVELVRVRRGTGQPSGFTWRRKHYLFIEEAVYLVDRGDLLLFVQVNTGNSSAPTKRLLSVQECYELMTTVDPARGCEGCSMERFLVYCTLMRQGYLVMRHPSCWILEASQDPSEACGEAWRPQRDHKEEAKAGVNKTASSRMDVDDDHDKGVGVLSMSHAGALRKKVVAKRDLDIGTQAGPASGSSTIKHRGWWAKAGPDHPHFNIKVDSADLQKEREEGGGWDFGPSLAFLLAPGVDLRKSFPKLRPLPPMKEPSQGLSTMDKASSGRRIELAYDVYSPGATRQVARAKKSFPSLTMHLVMCSDRPPSPFEIHKAEEQARAFAVSLKDSANEGGEGKRDAAPVFWASLDTGIVSFFGLVGVDLITLL